MNTKHIDPVATTTARILMFLFAAGLAVAVPSAGQAGSGGFRCPTTGRLVSVGQSMLEVRNRCREPDDALKSIELRTIRETVRKWVNGVAQEVTSERTVEIPVEDWTYDFGRNRFIQYLRFETGRLVSVGQGAKGTADPE